jgi:threonine/homoserine efflux transporter RhtA
MPAAGPLVALVFALLTRGAVRDHAWVAAAVLGVGALLSAARAIEQCSAATATVREVVDRLRRSEAL